MAAAGRGKVDQRDAGLALQDRDERMSRHLLKARRRRALPHLVAPSASTATRLGPPADERLWVEPAPDTLLDVEDDAGQRPDERVSLRESIGLAFITALQFLSPKQRAALLLVDVLGWRPQETAALLETSVFSVNSLLQRARKSVEAHKGGAAAPPEVSSSDAALLRRYITSVGERRPRRIHRACSRRTLSSRCRRSPSGSPGREAIRRFFAAVWPPSRGQRRLLPIRANGGPAVAVYTRPLLGGPYKAEAITLLTIRLGRVARMTRFTLPRLFPLFGLPTSLSETSTEDTLGERAHART